MVRSEKLYLHEAVLLLALRDREGTIAFGAMYQFAVGGAILAELLLNNRITVEETKGKLFKTKLVNVVSTTPLGDPLLDECLAKISTAKRRANLQNWVQRFANMGKLKHRIAGELCKRGILRVEEDKILLLFTRKIYPEVNPEPEKKLIGQMEEAIFSDTENVDPRTIVVISLARSADLLRLAFDKKKLKSRKKRIEQLINGDIIGKATKEAVEAMQAAVMVAVIIPAITTSTIAH